MDRQIFQIEFEVADEHLPAALAQASQVLSQIVLPEVVGKFAEFQVPLVMQTPTLTLQSAPRLEVKNG